LIEPELDGVVIEHEPVLEADLPEFVVQPECK
jgi:hypothetical protein